MAFGMNDTQYSIAVLGQVLAFARRTVERLSVLLPHWPGEQSAANLDKILSETAVLLLIAHRALRRAPVLSASVTTLAETLSPLVRSERARALLLRSPRSTSTFFLPHVMLTLAGYPDDAFDRHFDFTPADQWLGGERVAFRIAEARWLEGVVTGQAPEFADLLPFSVFAGDMDPFEMDRTDLYAFTHWLFYVTDFASRPVPSRIRRQAAALLDGALAWQIASEDLDLLAELLMVQAILGGPLSDHAASSWAVLTSAWEKFGFVPSPGFQASSFRALSGLGQEAYATANIYHTQFVFGMLAALIVHGAAAADTEPEEPEACDDDVVAACRRAVSRAAVFVGESDLPLGERRALLHEQTPGSCWNELLTLIPQQNGEAPFWTQAMSQLAEPGRSGVGIDALLVQAARRYDLDRVAKLVALTVAHSIAPSTTFRRAVLWLTRQQTPEGAIGAHFVNQENIHKAEAKLVTAVVADLLDQAGSYLAAVEGRSAARA
jgi:hypothetical protein